MAKLVSIVELDDRVSSKLDKIFNKAIAVDGAFDKLEAKLESFTLATDKTGDEWIAKWSEMREATRAESMGINDDIRKIKLELDTLTSRQHRIRLSMDTIGTEAKIKFIKHELGTLNNQSFRPVSSGSLFGGGFGGGGGGNRSGGIPINLPGPLGSVGSSTLIPLLITIGPAAISGLAAAVGVLAVGIGALSAALISATAIVGAFVLGIASVGVPIALAVKSTISWYQQQQTALKALEATRKGTVAYNNALYKYNRILKDTPESQRKVIAGFLQLKAAWRQDVTTGPVGNQALDILTSGLAIATKMVPFVAKEMSGFTRQASLLFTMIKKDTPNLEALMSQTFARWPVYFRQGGTATYQFGKGFLGLLRDAKPFTDYLSASLLSLGTRFDQFTNSASGQRELGRFFTEMIPVFKAMGGVIGDLGKAMAKMIMDPSNQRQTINFLHFLGDFVRALPPFVHNMTAAFAQTGPLWRTVGREITQLSNDMAPVADKILGTLGKILKKFDSMPASARHFIEGFLLVSNMPFVGKGIRAATAAIGQMVLGMGTKVLQIDKLTSAIKKLAVAFAELDLAEMAGGAVGGKGIGRLFGRGKSIGRIGLGGASDALPFEGSAAFGLGMRGINGGSALERQFLESQRLANLGGAAGQTAVGADRLGLGAISGIGTTGAAESALGTGIIGAGGVEGLTAGVGGVGGVAGSAAAGAAGIAAGPILLVVAAVVAAVGSMWYAWHTNMDNIQQYVSKVWGKVSGDFKSVGKDISQMLNLLGFKNKSFADAMSKAWSDGKKDLSTFWNYAKPVFATVGAILIQDLGAAFEMVGGVIKGTFQILLGFVQILKGIWELCNGNFGKAWTDLWNGVKNVFGGAWTQITSIIKAAWGFIKNVAGDIAHLFGIEASGGSSGQSSSAPNIQGTGIFAPGQPLGAPTFGAPVPGVTGKGPTGDVFSSIGGAVSSAAGSVGSAASSVWNGAKQLPGDALHGVKDVGSFLISKITGAIGNAESMIGNLAGKGPMGQLIQSGAENLLSRAKDKVLSYIGLGGSTGPAKFDMGMFNMVGNNTGLGKIAGLNSKLVGLASQLHKMFGVYVGEGFATSGHNAGSWHYSGDAMDMWGTQAELQAVWNALKGNASIGQLLWHGQEEFNGGSISAIPAGGAGTDPMHMGHVHIGVRGDASPRSIRASQVKPGDVAGGGVLIQLSIDNMQVRDKKDVDDLAKKLAKELKKQLDNIPVAPAKEMAH